MKQPATPELLKLKKQLSGIFLTDEFLLKEIRGGASTRRYFRIDFTGKSYFPEPTVALMLVPADQRTLLSDYVNIDYFCKRKGIKTPRLYEVHRPGGLLFMQFMLQPNLETHLRNHPDDVSKLIPAAVEHLLEMQKKLEFERHCPAFRRRFDAGKYRFEFNLHVRENLLDYYFGREYDQAGFQACAEELSTFLDISEPVFVHRDYQSSNLFWEEDETGQRFTIIDFQDARHGTPVYDLVSLLWDSYVAVPADLRKKMLEYFRREWLARGLRWERDYFTKLIDYTVIQRKLHDAGAFVLNYRRLQNRHYLPFVRGAVQMALEVLPEYPRLSCLQKILEDCLLTADDRHQPAGR